MVHLDYRDARPIYTQITDDLRNQIVNGILLDGDRLPSVRELAAQLAINPNTIQRAYRELEMQGYIASVPGKGSFVCGGFCSAHKAQQPLWDALDEAIRRLESTGVTKDELLRHIRQGGKGHA
jgi:GntR family transcriptional regulator